MRRTSCSLSSELSRMKRWRERPDDLDPGTSLAGCCARRSGDPRCSSVEEVPVFLTRLLAESLQQVRTVHATRKIETTAAPKPHERHSIRHDEIGVIEHFLERRITLSFRHAVHAGNGDVLAAVPGR